MSEVYAGMTEAQQQQQHPVVLQWGMLKVSQGIMHFSLGNSLYEKSLLSKVAAGSRQAILPMSCCAQSRLKPATFDLQVRKSQVTILRWTCFFESSMW